MKNLRLFIFVLITYLSFTLKAEAQTSGASNSVNQNNLTKEHLQSTYNQDDSSKAIINLFYRKRKGAHLRGIISGGLAGYSAGSAIGSGDIGSVYIGPLLFSPLIITSITQNAKYKQSVLLQILEEHKSGNPFPQKFRKKLKKKDFKQ